MGNTIIQLSSDSHEDGDLSEITEEMMKQSK